MCYDSSLIDAWCSDPSVSGGSTMGFILTPSVASSKLIGGGKFILVAFSFAFALFAVVTKVMRDSMHP